MKTVLTIIALWITILAIMYGAFAFGNWNWNPGAWGTSRELFAIFGAISTFASAGIVSIIKQGDQD
jgi:hypothetical protein